MADDLEWSDADRDAAKRAWNAIADEFNQWDALSLEEAVSWIVSFARHRMASTESLRAENARLTEERDALVEAAEYLIGQFKKVSRGVAVRDLDEALGAYDSAIAKVKGGTDAR
ncbi:hypothetical protein [Sphingopyxis sp. MG]|uniref:hypothetical protein n=1 Tax=Sphingopyxis sp. MG TaxID=1866325 RepID=UPI000CDF4DB0|nr:hypothetical protein [Sphingopyxis sp. MG]AVA13832.1 hypothetical protein C3E99_08290 [Sphingopyxis sp. MG]